MNQKLIENISSDSLKNLIDANMGHKVFLVTGKKSYAQSGAQGFIESALNEVSYVRFSEFEQNPKYEDAVRGTQIFQESDCDMIVAIGGGSVLDMAKLINTFVAHSEINGMEIVKNSKRIAKKGKLLIALPTTAGTGSEATHFAVVYHNNKKYSVTHESILPDIVGLNSIFTTSQPKYLTACTGLDAFSQAIESYWSVGATEQSKSYAKKAIALLLLNLFKVVNSPCEESRKSVMKGAYWAGKAINISKTTAAHAVSYAFTTYYSIPHGHAVFLTLPEFFEYNYEVLETDINDPRGLTYIKRNGNELCELLGVNSAEAAKQFLYAFAKKLNIELSLEKLDIKNYEDIIADNVNMERLGNNPREISKEGLIELLKSKLV